MILDGFLESEYNTSGFDDSSKFPPPSLYDFKGVNDNGVHWFTKVLYGGLENEQDK